MIYLRKDKTVWYDEEEKVVVYKGEKKSSSHFIERLVTDYLNGEDVVRYRQNETTNNLQQQFRNMKTKDFKNFDELFFSEDYSEAEAKGLTWIKPKRGEGYSFKLPVNPTQDSRDKYNDEIWNRLRKIDIYKYGGQQVYNRHILLDAIYQFPIIKCEDEDLSWNALRSRNTLVLAPNGFGKTTFLKGLTLSIISQEKTELDQTEKLFYKNLRNYHGIQEKTDILPIYISAERIDSEAEKDAFKILFKALSMSEIGEADFESICKNARSILLLIDGLDEVSREIRVKIQGITRQFSGLFDDVRCIFTSRPALSGNINVPTEWEIKPLKTSNKKEMISFINSYLAYLPSITKTGEQLYNILCKNRYLSELAISPDILIHIISDIAQSTVETHQIAEETQVRLIRRYESFHNNRGEQKIVTELYEEMALQITLGKSFSGDEIKFSREITGLYNSIIKNSTFQVQVDEEFVNYLPERMFENGGLLRTENGVCSFLSPVIMEHLAAKCAIKKSIDKDGMLNKEAFRDNLDGISETYRLDIMEMIAVLSKNLVDYFDNIHDSELFEDDIWEILLKEKDVLPELLKRTTEQKYGSILPYFINRIINSIGETS